MTKDSCCRSNTRRKIYWGGILGSCFEKIVFKWISRIRFTSSPSFLHVKLSSQCIKSFENASQAPVFKIYKRKNGSKTKQTKPNRNAETERNWTKRNETKQNRTKRKETKRNETKRNETTPKQKLQRQKAYPIARTGQKHSSTGSRKTVLCLLLMMFVSTQVKQVEWRYIQLNGSLEISIQICIRVEIPIHSAVTNHRREHVCSKFIGIYRWCPRSF